MYFPADGGLVGSLIRDVVVLDVVDVLELDEVTCDEDVIEADREVVVPLELIVELFVDERETDANVELVEEDTVEVTVEEVDVEVVEVEEVRGIELADEVELVLELETVVVTECDVDEEVAIDVELVLLDTVIEELDVELVLLDTPLEELNINVMVLVVFELDVWKSAVEL